MFAQRAPGREELADDLSQRTWLAVWQALRDGKYDPGKSAITTFIYAVGYKVWLQHLRQLGRDHEHAADAEALEAMGPRTGDDAASAAGLSEVLDALRQCLHGGEAAGGLTAEERHIVTEASSGVGDRELAKRLGVAPSTLNVRKQAALAKIRRFLAQRGHRTDSAEQPGGPGERQEGPRRG